MPLSVCFHPFSSSVYLCILFLLQVEVPPSTTNGTLGEEVIATSSVILLGLEEEPPNGGMTKEVSQPMQGVQPILQSIPLATQDPETLQPPVSQDPQLKQTFSPIKTMSPEPVFSKEPLGGASPSTQAGKPHSPLLRMLDLTFLVSPFFFKVPISSSPFRSNQCEICP